MAPRIVFVVMSAVTPAATVDQLARALMPHRVLVHHDFSQVPDFRLASPNASFVPDPRRTGWATFGFVEGIFHALRHALDHVEFDYLQLLSPTCLPIKPMAAFEAHVAHGAEAHFGAIDVLGDRECLMSVGYRAFTQDGTFRHRVLRRLSSEYFGTSELRRDEDGVWLHAGGGAGWRGRAALAVTRLAAARALGRHPFGPKLRPYYGSVWFGARTTAVRTLVEGFERREVREWASRMRIAEEFLVPTLLMQSGGTRGPLNHYITRFDQAHPGRLSLADLPELRSMPAFFARKFSDAADDPVRLAVLQELACERPALRVQPRRADLAGLAGLASPVELQPAEPAPLYEPASAMRAAAG